MLFADQLGWNCASCRAIAGVRWTRSMTDVPTALLDVLAGRLGVREYVRSVRRCDVEAVFSRGDPKPGLAEIALLPYLYAKRGF
jgi:predicted ATP-grasp superfamily ATP-dependent carboligase